MKKLQLNTIYNEKAEGIVIPGLSNEQIGDFISSGRICGVMLEGMIANKFEGCSQGTQGNDADIYWNGKKIQCKTANYSKSKPHLEARHRAKKKIWTSKSGLWDKTPGKQISVEDYYEQLEAYYDDYDYFMIIDISKMREFEYSFIVVDSQTIKDNQVQGRIAWTDLKT